MDEKKTIKGFSEAEFLELIKNDPETVADYKKQAIELNSRRIYSEEQLIRLLTGKTRNEVSRDYTLPQLMRLSWALDFLQDNPCGNLYIHKLEEEKSNKRQ